MGLLDSYSGTSGSAGGMDMSSILSMLQKNQQTSGQSLAQVLPYLSYLGNANSYNQNSQNLSGAMTDTSSPQYQGIYNQFKQQGQQNLAESIAEADRQNRKSAALGRTPLFSQDRNGEQDFRNMTQGYQDVQNNASKQAFGQINNAYQSAAVQDQLKQKNALQKADVFGNATGAIAKLFGL